MGVILNKADNTDLTEIYTLAKESDIDIIGSIPIDTNTEIIAEAVKHFIPDSTYHRRMNNDFRR